MGLFNLLGASSPMFIPRQEKVEGFNIDYDKLAPALPKQQQAPGLAANDYSKIDWTPGHLQAQHERELQAQQYLQQAYNKSGGNFTTLANIPEFKQAQQLMSIDPLVAAQRSENKKMLDETKKQLIDDKNPKGNLVDVDYFNKTGIKRTLSDAWQEAYNDKSDDINFGSDSLAALTKYGSQAIGTQQDFNENIEKFISGVTGKTSDELKTFHKENFDANGNIIEGKRDNIKSLGPHYGLIETLLSKETNTGQLASARREIMDNMDAKMRYAINNDFINDTGLRTDFSQYNEKDRDKVQAIYDKYVVDKIGEYLGTKETKQTKREETFKSYGDALLDAKHRLEKGKMQEELTGPWTRAYQGIEAPSGLVKNNTMMLTDKTGKTTQFIPSVTDEKGQEHPIQLGEWKGVAYSYSPGKAKIPANIVGNDVLFSGKENEGNVLPKSAFVININSVQQIPDKDAQAYFSNAKPGQEITAEQASQLNKNNQWRFKKVVNVTAAIPYEDFISGAGQKLEGYTNDDNKGKVVPAYDFHIFGKDLAGDMVDPDALKFGEVDGQKVVFINYQTTPTEESLIQLNRLTKESEKIKTELPAEQEEKQ